MAVKKTLKGPLGLQQIKKFERSFYGNPDIVSILTLITRHLNVEVPAEISIQFEGRIVIDSERRNQDFYFSHQS